MTNPDTLRRPCPAARPSDEFCKGRAMRRAIAATLLLTLALTDARADPPVPASAYLVPAFQAGDRIDQVFSRTFAIRAPGFEDIVGRTSGTATYRAVESATDRPRLRLDYRYDGRSEGGGMLELRDAGATACLDGACAPQWDASGLIYNPRLWGAPPAALRVGRHWTVDIDSPWELGTPGRQTVTVVALDPLAHRVTLKREGEGDGAYLGDRLQVMLKRGDKNYAVKVQPGRSHWYGYTTFRHGVVTSDELMVERPVTLSSKELGRVEAREREYILLNEMPAE